MQVFYSPHSDMILAALSIGLLIAGFTCLCLSRETRLHGETASWFWLGIALIVSALRDWVGIIGISINVFPFYLIATLFQSVAALAIFRAARIEMPANPRPWLSVLHHAATAALCLLIVAQAAQFLTGAAYFGAFQVAAAKAMFLLGALFLLYCARASDPDMPAPYLYILAALAAYGVFMNLCLPPGVSAKFAIEPRWNNVHFILYMGRIAAAFALATLVWSVYARAVGVKGAVRWWPLALMYAVALSGFIFVMFSFGRYRTVVTDRLVDSARNAARAIRPGTLRRAAETGSVGVADSLFTMARQLAFNIGYTKVHPFIYAVSYDRETGAGTVVHDPAQRPAASFEPGPWAETNPWTGDGRAAILHDLRNPALRPPQIVAPVQDATGRAAGAVVLLVPPLELVQDAYVFKRQMLLFMPIGFFILLLMMRGQQRSWLSSHSSNWREALKTGALANDLAGVIVTRGDRVLDVNRRACDMLEAKPEELMGRTLADAVRPATPGDAEMMERFRLVSRRGGGSLFEMEMRTVSGAPVHAMVFVRPLPEEPGGDTYVWEAVDVTRLKEMEKQIRGGRDYLQMVLDTLPVGVFVKDMEGRYSLANRSFARQLGYDDPADVVGRRAGELLGQLDEAATENDSRCMDMGGDTLVYDQHIVLDGEEKFYEVYKTLKWKEGAGRDFLIVGCMHDFTGRKKIEDAVKAERHFLLQLINALPIVVCFLDRNRLIRLCNTAFSREAGFSDPERLVGLPYDDVAPFGPVDVEGEERMLEVGHGFKDMAIDVRRHSRNRHFVLRRIAMASEEGETLGLLKAFWETTDLVEANRAALAAGRARNAFLTNMSHELRTPMNGVLGMASLIMNQETATPEQRLYAETIAKSAKTLQMVVDEVMDIATLEDDSKRFAVRTVSFNLLALAEETVQIESCIVEAWGVELTLEFDLGLRQAYLGDPARIRQIMVQILSHCSRISPRSRVRLAIGPAPDGGEGVAIATRFRPGDGSGAADLEALFRASGQARGDTARLGAQKSFNDRVGLPLIWRLVDAMRGRLRVEDEADGIVCRVALPLQPDPSVPPAIARPDLRGVRILVVSDVQEHANVLRNILSYAGASVSTAEERIMLDRLAATRAEDIPFHLVLIDSNRKPVDHLPELLGRMTSDQYGNPARAVLVSSREAENRLGSIGHLVETFVTLPLCPSDLWNKARLHSGRPPAVPSPAPNDDDGPRAETGRPPSSHSTRIEALPRFDASVLLVEDNTVNQMVQMSILKRLGCSPELARNGAEALDMIRSGREFDLVLMDCMMPVMDGYEATTRIRLHERSHPECKRHTIVALTANSVEGDREKCLASGMDDYLAKPVTLEAIRDAMKRHCPSRMVVGEPDNAGAGD